MMNNAEAFSGLHSVSSLSFEGLKAEAKNFNSDVTPFVSACLLADNDAEINSLLANHSMLSSRVNSQFPIDSLAMELISLVSLKANEVKVPKGVMIVDDMGRDPLAPLSTEELRRPRDDFDDFDDFYYLDEGTSESLDDWTAYRSKKDRPLIKWREPKGCTDADFMRMLPPDYSNSKNS